MPSERTTGIILLGVAVALAGSVSAYLLANAQPEVERDPDFCPSRPIAATFALIDGTDGWPRSERERIANGLLATAERMRKDERLSLHVITSKAEDSTNPWKGFQRCKSADPNAVNAMQENERLVRAEFSEKFLDPLKALLPELTKGATAPNSPILEAIELVMWSPHFRSELAHRTLEIYSDLLQHTTTLSHLAGRLPDPCTVLASDIGRRLVGHDWRGLVVRLYYLRNTRDGARQGPQHLRWWSTLFYRLGAAQVFDGATLVTNESTPCASRSPSPSRKCQATLSPMPASRIQSVDLDGRGYAGGVDLSQGAPQARGIARTLDRAVSAAGHNQPPIDFQLIRERVTLAMVLSRDGLLSSLRKLGRQHSTTCPIHGGSDPRQFVVHLPTNRWFCFSPQCNRGGGVIDYVMLRERVDARRAAELIAQRFAIGPPRHLPPRPHVKRSSLMNKQMPSHKVFVVENREADSDAEQGGFWTQIGVAWPHKDGKGLNLQIKPNISVSGRLVLREWTDDEQRAKAK